MRMSVKVQECYCFIYCGLQCTTAIDWLSCIIAPADLIFRCSQMTQWPFFVYRLNLIQQEQEEENYFAVNVSQCLVMTQIYLSDNSERQIFIGGYQQTSWNVRNHKFGHVCPAKFPISLRIRAVWSESSLDAFWTEDSTFFLRTKKTDQIARMRRLIWVIVRAHLVEGTFLSMRLKYFYWDV